MSYSYYVIIFFFFQAEDGIRDFCLSRGLGDVYKSRTTGVSIPYTATNTDTITDAGKCFLTGALYGSLLRSSARA